MKIIITLFILFLTLNVFSSNKSANQVLDEGQMLFRLEKASWYGTDDFIERFPHKHEKAGGYLSYQNENGNVVNIFYSNDDPFKIIVRYYFDKTPKKSPLKIDTINDLASTIEKKLIKMRIEALNRVNLNTNNFYAFYKNTNLNFIPIIKNRQRKVFIITAPIINNVLILGNDYLLTFNKKNQIINEEKIHNSLLEFPFSSENPENKITSTKHSHVLSGIISSTDICTLLLYRDFVEWKIHYVIGKKYVSIFDLEKESLLVLTKEAIQNITNINQ